MSARVMALEKHNRGYFRILPVVIIEEIIEIGKYRDKECMEDVSYVHKKQ